MVAQMSAQIPEEALRRVQELLARWHLPPGFMNELIEHKAPVTFPKGETIFLQGSTSDVAFWILSGLVKVYLLLADGNRILVRIGGPGEFIGTVDGMVTTARRVQLFEAEAMTKVSVAIFTRDYVHTLLKTLTPDSLVALLENVNTSWSTLFSWSLKFLGLSFRDRLRCVLEDLADRYGARDSRGILLTPKLSHDDLAEMIGSSRAMVSRLIAEFIDSGELVRQGKHLVVIKNASATRLRASATTAVAATRAIRNQAPAHLVPALNKRPF